VVIGADAGSKAAKAATLGVTTLDEAAWLELAGIGEEHELTAAPGEGQA
jgi:DNA ligase (NAD+)